MTTLTTLLTVFAASIPTGAVLAAIFTTKGALWAGLVAGPVIGGVALWARGRRA